MDGLVRIKPLVNRVAELGMPAVAVTDQSNLFSVIKFYSAAVAAGIKPILGADCWIGDARGQGKPTRLVLLCRDNRGYHNLTCLISRSYTEGQSRGVPMVRRQWLEDSADGLIALSGGCYGDVGQALLGGQRDEAISRLGAWQQIFGDDFYLELQRTSRPDDEPYLHGAVDLAATMGVPVVASNDVRFLAAEEFDSHEVRVCVHDGRTLDDPRRPRHYSTEQFLKGPAEMAQLFADIPEALENSVEIARRCNVELILGRSFLPDFPVPQSMNETDYLIKAAQDGLEVRLKNLFDTTAPDFEGLRKRYDERLQRELDVIVQMGFEGYFLIVADFIRWARSNGVAVGPGRGSGSGSLVAYVLTITDLDPLEYDLLFERFLNPERVSMPDFDIDFCMEGRDRVVDYVSQRYGREKVAQIITYGKMAAKAVVRDVGRVLGYPYGFVDRIAKLVPFAPDMTLEKAMEQAEELRTRYEGEEEVTALIDMARSVEGITRNAGRHAGGVVIAPSVLTDFTPLYCEEGGEGIVTQFDKDDVEAVGLVKFDFLGLRTLTIIEWALDNIRRTGSGRRDNGALEVPDVGNLPLDDNAAFATLKAARTTAVFQLESRGMKELIGRLQPDCFEDIIALMALFRPGPLQSGMVDNFINRKHGREQVSYPDPRYQHEMLKSTLEPTYGIILYQEQVMQIAQSLAGYTLGDADLLRRAMGKKKPAEMAQQRAVFEKGAKARGVNGELAVRIFDLMEKFAGYGFNKSHSATYALVAYQTLWLKTHYPAEFMAAVLSADMNSTDKMVGLIEECKIMGLKVERPLVNRSAYRFTVDEHGSVVYGLGAIKGVGAGVIEEIVSERAKHGPYQDLFDLCRRISLRKVNRRALESLIRAGALDELGTNRATLNAALPQATQFAEQDMWNRDSGIEDMFGLDGGNGTDQGSITFDEVPEWDEEIKLTGEKETLGLYLTGHPVSRYIEEFGFFTTGRINELNPEQTQNATVAGLVVSVRTRTTKRGENMGFVILDDRTGRLEITLFADTYSQYRDLLATDHIVVVSGELRHDDYTNRTTLRAEEVFDIEHARAHYARSLDIDLAPDSDLNALTSQLETYRESGSMLQFNYSGAGAACVVDGGEGWRVRPTDDLLGRLRRVLGERRVRMRYQENADASPNARMGGSRGKG